MHLYLWSKSLINRIFINASEWQDIYLIKDLFNMNFEFKFKTKTRYQISQGADMNIWISVLIKLELSQMNAMCVYSYFRTVDTPNKNAIATEFTDGFYFSNFVLYQHLTR
jgi:hypothetical protein